MNKEHIDRMKMGIHGAQATLQDSKNALECALRCKDLEDEIKELKAALELSKEAIHCYGYRLSTRRADKEKEIMEPFMDDGMIEGKKIVAHLQGVLKKYGSKE